MFFSYLGLITFVLVLTAGAGANLYEVIMAVKKRRDVPLAPSIFLALYLVVLVSLGGLMWLLSTMEWD